MKIAENSVDPMERDYIVLTRMLADADQLCRTDDAFMIGQYRHLRGRVAALLEQTRPLGAGTIIGSGTVSNDDASRGYGCLLEKRADEQRAGSAARTSFLRFGDRVRIEMRDSDGQSIFGAIEQEVRRC